MIEEFQGMGYLYLQIGNIITYGGPWGAVLYSRQNQGIGSGLRLVVALFFKSSMRIVWQQRKATLLLLRVVWGL
jgi:hypothetical protein